MAELRSYIDRVKAWRDAGPKTLAFLGVFGIIAQSLGGLIFLVYFWSIGFMPDMDLQTSLTLLIAVALTGGFLIIWLAFLLVYPGLVFGLSVKDGEFTVKQLVLAQLWFVLPMAVFSFLVFVSFKWFPSYVLLAVKALSIATASLTSLLRRHCHGKWEGSRSLFFYFALSAFGFLLTLYILFSVITASRLDQFNSVLLVLLIITISAVFAFARSTPARQSMGLLTIYLVQFGLVIVLIITLFAPSLIPNAVMHLYKFGHFEAASLVLKNNEGCAISRDHGLQEGAPCHFADVMICSRLGSTYYVEVRKANTPARFTIPAQDVLSWGVADEQLPEAGCKSTKKP